MEVSLHTEVYNTTMNTHLVSSSMWLKREHRYPSPDVATKPVCIYYVIEEYRNINDQMKIPNKATHLSSKILKELKIIFPN